MIGCSLTPHTIDYSIDYPVYFWKPKTRNGRKVFRTLSDDVQSEFEYLSDVYSAYRNAVVSQSLKIWDFGEP